MNYLTVKIYTAEGKLVYCGVVPSENVEIGEEINSPRTARITFQTVDFLERLRDVIPENRVYNSTEEFFEALDDLVDERTYITGVGQVLRGVHDPEACGGRPCVIHNPSDHHMKDWDTCWRSGGFLDIKPPHMERLCEHGIGHPDPDDATYLLSLGEDVGVHGCDGCCRPLTAR